MLAAGTFQNGQNINEVVGTPCAHEDIDNTSGHEREEGETSQPILQSSSRDLCAEDRNIENLAGIVSGSSAYFMPQQTLPGVVLENERCEELITPQIQNEHDEYVRPPSFPGAFRICGIGSENMRESNVLNDDLSAAELIVHARLVFVPIVENTEIFIPSLLVIPGQIIPPVLSADLVKQSSSIRDESICLLFATRRNIVYMGLLLICVVAAASLSIILLRANHDKQKISKSNLDDAGVPPSPLYTVQPKIDIYSSLQPTPALTQTRQQLIYNLVLPIYCCSGATAVFNDTSSPQYQALRWISEEDYSFLDINNNSKRIVERYIVSVFHFSTCNDDCLSPLFFLKANVDVCFWNDIFEVSVMGVVSCDTNGFIKEIDLTKISRNGANSLTGTIPHELSQLKQLKMLRLANNHLRGTLPPSLGQLLSLTVIDISSNDIEGTIPENNGLNSSLAYMSYRNNKLTGTIPGSLGLNPNLMHLDFGSNKLTGTIPRELSRLEQLKRVKLRNNNLTGTLPSSMGQLQRLELFDISHNRIEGTVPEEIGLISSLYDINFSSNMLTGITPQIFCGLDKLELLDLRRNRKDGIYLQGSLQCLCDADSNTILKEMKIYVNIYYVECTCCSF